MAFGFDLNKLKSLFGADLKKGSNGPIVGVDVGASSIKLVQIHMEKEVPTLDTYGELQLGPYDKTDIGRAVSLSLQRSTEAFVDIVRESSVTGTVAALSISYAASFSTTLTLNATSEEEIASLVPVEARKYIPVSLNEVTLDWFTLATNEEKKQTTIFLVAIHNDGFNDLQNVLTSAGFSLAYAELEPFSATRSALSPESTTVAIIDLGASATKLYLIEEGTLQKTHSIAGGGVALTTALATGLSIPFADAEEQKRLVGLGAHEENPNIGQLLRGSLDKTTNEIARVLSDYTARSGKEFATVLLIGGGASMVGIDAYLGDKLQRKVTISTPFNKVAYPAFLEDSLKEAGPSFAVAIGAALRQSIV